MPGLEYQFTSVSTTTLKNGAVCLLVAPPFRVTSPLLRWPLVILLPWKPPLGLRRGSGLPRGGAVVEGLAADLCWEKVAIMAGTLCSRDMWWRGGSPAQALVGDRKRERERERERE